MKRREFLKKSAGLLSVQMIAPLIEDKKNLVERKPNIIFILADDLGYGDLGCYGQKLIKTPNIDQLAANGLRFTQYYAGSPVCAPSRCVLLTGKHPGHAYIRGNDEWNSRGDVWDFEKMAKDPSLEGQRPLPKDSTTLGKLLQKAGYRTGCIGKWGLGAPGSVGAPNLQGFDFFYGYNCQRQAHNYYPTHLWKNNRKVLLNNKLVIPHKKYEIRDPDKEESFQDFNQEDYAPDLMEKEALDFIQRNKNKPFFLYYPSPIPHLPLQAPKKYVNKYHKIFKDDQPYLGKSYFPCQYPKATYAAMISYLDDQVGNLIRKLKEIGEYDNTLIFFSSDNGPTYTGGADTQFFNSSGVFGEKYGEGKGFVHEGGIRVPMIASWPKKIKPGLTTDHISAFWDMLPTLCDVARLKTPANIDGLSFLPELLQKEGQKKHHHLYWEFPAYEGQQAVRMGKWKGIRKNILKGNLKIELYDLESDPQEKVNLALKFPKVVSKIQEIMKKEHVESILDKFKIPQIGDKISPPTNEIP